MEEKIIMNTIAAIIVTYNRRELLKQNIECLLAQTASDFDILIIDNASTDGTNQLVSEYASYEKIKYHNTGKNLGGAGGFQFGIKKAVLLGYEYLWIMDDDCLPNANALEKLIQAGKELNNDYGFLSSKVIWTDGQLCTMNVQKQSLTKQVTNFGDATTAACFASFVSLFIKSEIVKKLGLPIKEFFIWSDDWEYTRRISLKYKCYVVGSSVVIHASKNNVPANIAIDEESRLGRYNYLYRNEMYLYRKIGFKGFFYQMLRLPYHALRVICISKSLKWKRLSTILCGSIKGLTFNPEIEYIDSHNI